MMRVLGESILTDPSKHSFLDAVKEYLGDRTEFVAGWDLLGLLAKLSDGRFNRYGYLLKMLVSLASAMGRTLVNRYYFNVCKYGRCRAVWRT